VLSRWPLSDVKARDLAGDGLPALDGRIAVGGRDVRFIGLHTRWPMLPQLATWRDASLRAAADLAYAEDGPVVALGDLNLTPYSPEFAAFLRASGLRDAMHGARWRPTWLAGFWPLALRIDHVLVSPDLCVEEAEVGPDIGSDHRPVIAHLSIPGARPVSAAAFVIPAPASPRSAAETPGSSR
jgi:endonuclease/exonuclease/phosphatase family metal-dependent hydrolase